MPDLSPDLRAHRDWLLSFVPMRDGASIVDLGCGAGTDLVALARMHPEARARFIGLDVSERNLGSAASHTREDPRLSFEGHDLEHALPFESASVDAVFTHNVLECVADPEGLAGEIARILRPGGVVVAAHWDWDSQTFDGTDKARIRRLVQAFADWQQPWMRHSDGWMGRRLWGIFASTGCFEGTVHVRAMTNTAFEPPWYGHARAQDLQALVKHSQASAAEVASFLQEQAALHAQGRYFYCINGFAYVGARRHSAQPHVHSRVGQ
jgi:SAM-dependent methyltransferase